MRELRDNSLSTPGKRLENDQATTLLFKSVASDMCTGLIKTLSVFLLWLQFVRDKSVLTTSWQAKLKLNTKSVDL